MTTTNARARKTLHKLKQVEVRTGVRLGQIFADEDDDEHEALVICCQGPPRCSLEGDEAQAAQEAGCVWCTRIIIHEDGTETVTEPAAA